MKISISERIQLHKLGYSREDIDNMINEPDPEPVADPQPDPKQEQPDVMAALRALTEQVQQLAVKQSEAPNPQPEETTFDILNKLVNNIKSKE